METTVDGAPRTLSHRLLANQHLKHNIYLLAANLLGALCGYLLQVLLVHRLGLAAYGSVASLLAVATAILIPTQVIGAIVARYGAIYSSTGRPAELNDLVRRLTRLLLVVGTGVTALVALLSVPVAAFLHLDSPAGVVIIGLMLGLSFVAPINIGAVQGLQYFSWYAFLVALPQVLRFVLASALVVLGFGVNGAMLGILLGLLLSYLMSFQPLSPLLSGPRQFSGPLRALGFYSATATVTLAVTVVLSNFDTPLAKHYLSAHDAGLYAGMALIGKILLIVSNSIVMVMFPRFAALYSRGESMQRAVLQGVLSVLGPCLLLEAAYSIAPAALLRTLFGPPFVAVADQLPAYGLAMVLLGLSQVFIYYFLSIDGRLFMLVLLLCGGLQGLLFAIRHGSVAQLVQASVIANALMVMALGTLCVVSLRTARRPVPREETIA